MRDERDLELPEEALIPFFPQMGDIWAINLVKNMEFRKSNLAIQTYNFAKTYGNQGISFDMSPDQYDLDKERELGLCGVAVAIETEATECSRLLHIPNHFRHFGSLGLLPSD